VYEFWAKNKIFTTFGDKGHIPFPRTQDGINSDEILTSPRFKQNYRTLVPECT
jgi:hypothetical protein